MPGGRISPAVRSSHFDFSTHYGMRTLLPCQSVRRLPLPHARGSLLIRSEPISTALPKQLMKQSKNLNTARIFSNASVDAALRAVHHLWRRPDRYRSTVRITPSNSRFGSREYSSLLMQTENADARQSSFSTSGKTCSTRYPVETSVHSSRKPGFVQDDCVSSKTTSSDPLRSKRISLCASRKFSKEKSSSASVSSHDLRFPSSCSSALSTSPIPGLYEDANFCSTVGYPLANGTASVVCVNTVHIVNKLDDEPHTGTCRVSDVFRASCLPSMSTLPFTIPPYRKQLTGRNLVFSRLQGLRPSCCTSPITKSSYNITQACHFSSTTKSTSSSSQKQEDSMAFCPSEIPENLSWNWWDMYVQGINPDYPPRQRMFAFLTSQGVSVKEMEIHEVEEFTKYLEMRRVYGDKFPALPYDIKFGDKLDDLRQKYPLAPGKTKAKKGQD